MTPRIEYVSQLVSRNFQYQSSFGTIDTIRCLPDEFPGDSCGRIKFPPEPAALREFLAENFSNAAWGIPKLQILT
jgi:hypothetical protein